MTLSVIFKNQKSDTNVSDQKNFGHISYLLNKVCIYANKLVMF
jgi:hypothetical protein